MTTPPTTDALLEGYAGHFSGHVAHCDKCRTPAFPTEQDIQKAKDFLGPLLQRDAEIWTATRLRFNQDQNVDSLANQLLFLVRGRFLKASPPQGLSPIHKLSCIYTSGVGKATVSAKLDVLVCSACLSLQTNLQELMKRLKSASLDIVSHPVPKRVDKFFRDSLNAMGLQCLAEKGFATIKDGKCRIIANIRMETAILQDIAVWQYICLD